MPRSAGATGRFVIKDGKRIAVDDKGVAIETTTPTPPAEKGRARSAAPVKPAKKR